jgi:hypothetical protein
VETGKIDEHSVRGNLSFAGGRFGCGMKAKIPV